MRIGNALVIHRHVKETGGTERLAGGIDLFQMPTKRFFALVEAEDGLECRCLGRCMRRVLRHCVIESVSNRSLERLVKNSAPAHGVQVLQFALELCDMGWRPLLHNRGVKAAQLRHMKKRPGALDGRWRRRDRELFSKGLA
jgi:hypothetical protein